MNPNGRCSACACHVLIHHCPAQNQGRCLGEIAQMHDEPVVVRRIWLVCRDGDLCHHVKGTWRPVASVVKVADAMGPLRESSMPLEPPGAECLTAAPGSSGCPVRQRSTFALARSPMMPSRDDLLKSVRDNKPFADIAPRREDDLMTIDVPVAFRNVVNSTSQV